MITRKGYLKDYTFIDEDTGEVIILSYVIKLNMHCYVMFKENTPVKFVAIEYYPYNNKIGCIT